MQSLLNSYIDHWIIQVTLMLKKNMVILIISSHQWLCYLNVDIFRICRRISLRPATLLKKSLWYRCFSVNFAKFPTTPFFTEHFRWLLLIYSLVLLHYVSVIPDRYRSVPIFISDRPSVFIGTDFFRHDFHNEVGLERSDSESDKRRIG